MCGVGRESEARDDRDLVSQPLMHRPQSQVSRVINLNLARKNVVASSSDSSMEFCAHFAIGSKCYFAEYVRTKEHTNTAKR